METSFTVSTLEDLRKVALYLKNYYWHNKIFYLKGPIGVGKTQLVQYLLPEYNVTSPTFSLLNIYGENYWHFDLYNREEVQLWQMEEVGFDGIWQQDTVKCFIEWPEKLSFHINALHVVFSYEGTQRKINIYKGITYDDNKKKISGE